MKNNKSYPEPVPTGVVVPADWPERRDSIDDDMGPGSPESAPSREGVENLVLALSSSLSPDPAVAGLLLGPFCSGNEMEMYLWGWCRRANEAWLPFILDVCREPPELSKYSRGTHFEFLSDLPRLLRKWIRAKPQTLPQIVALAQDAAVRPLILKALGAVGHPDIVPLLRPMLAKLDDLPQQEIVYLIQAVSATGTVEGTQFLESMKGLIPKGMIRAEFLLSDTLEEGIEDGEKFDPNAAPRIFPGDW